MSKRLLILWLLAGWGFAVAGEVGDNQRIASAHLGYELQYRVYVPSGAAGADKLPSLYVTDGQWYLRDGELDLLIEQMIADGRIRPLIAVFVDSRNPENLAENRRTDEFMCKKEYAAFFTHELVPAITAAYPVGTLASDRVILGMSFGGLNAACFGIMATDVFGGLAMQSPASASHVDVVRELYEASPRLPVKMFLSVGTDNDNIKAVSRFRRTLEDKGYDLAFRKVRRGHDWKNWKPLLDDVLLTFFAREQASR